MLKYHVAVCDDEKSDLDGIVQSVQQYDVQGCFDIETYMDGNELLSELQMQKKSFDLLLLDIEMPSNGFQLAQSLIQMEKHPLVVFVTKRHEYAVQGYGNAESTPPSRAHGRNDSSGSALWEQGTARKN